MSRDLCPSCVEVWWSWFDYRQPVPLRIHTIGKIDPEAQFDRWKDTVQSQQQIIAEICRTRHVGQLELFAVCS